MGTKTLSEMRRKIGVSGHFRTDKLQKRLQSAEMWFYRRMLRVSWIDHISNSEVLSMAGRERKLIQAVRRRQLQFLGHVLRKQELEDVALTGKIEGKRTRGKQRLTYISNLSQWMGKSERDILRTAKDKLQKRLQSAEMWFYRRMLRVSWIDHISNSEVLSMAGRERKLIQAVRRRQLQFLGHVLRKQELEDVALTGKIEGKRTRVHGHQRSDRIWYLKKKKKLQNFYEPEMQNVICSLERSTVKPIGDHVKFGAPL